MAIFTHVMSTKDTFARYQTIRLALLHTLLCYFLDDCHKLWPVGHIVNAVRDEGDKEEEEVEDIFEWSTRFSTFLNGYDGGMLSR